MIIKSIGNGRVVRTKRVPIFCEVGPRLSTFEGLPESRW
jgi:hypothetical protein